MGFKQLFKALSEKSAELEQAYADLAVKQAPVQPFLTQDQMYFDRKINSALRSVDDDQALEKLSLKKEKLSSEIRASFTEKLALEAEKKSLPPENPETPQEMRQQIADLEQRIEGLTQTIAQKSEQSVAIDAEYESIMAKMKKEKEATTAKLSWGKGDIFDSSNTKNFEFTPAQFNEFIDAHHRAIQLRKEVLDIIHQIGSLMRTKIEPSKEKEKTEYKPGEEEALQKAWREEKQGWANWAQKNSEPVVQRAMDAGKPFINSYFMVLDEKYQQAADKHLQLLGKESLRSQYAAGKLHVHDLEQLVEDRNMEQAAYRAVLPDYVLDKISPDLEIKGHRALFGIAGKPDTLEKVMAITRFLETPFGTTPKQKVTETIKELFNKVNVAIDNDAAEYIYEHARSEQAPPQPRHHS